jgi:hypothetical protein
LIPPSKNSLHSAWRSLTALALSGKEYMTTFPSLNRVGEGFRLRNADEKVRCEAGAYAWFRIAHLDPYVFNLIGT